MIELVGLIFGGAARLAQHWLDLRDKQAERDHEHRMYERQLELADRRFVHDADMRKMDGELRQDEIDASILIEAIRAQAEEASKAGGWVAKLSASVRPITLYWLLVLYSVSKAAGLYLLLRSGVQAAEAIQLTYTAFDGATLSSALSYWLADRSLRKRV